MTTPPDPIELPERVYGPCEFRDIPDGWEWRFVYRCPDPRRVPVWYSYAVARSNPVSASAPSTLVWVREPESPTIERNDRNGDTMTTPDPIELPERIHGPVRPEDVPPGWEWKYALYDPHTKGCWHGDAPAPSRYMVWVREPEPDPATVEIDADLALRLANDASMAAIRGSRMGSTAAERALLRQAASKAKRANR